MGPRAKFKDVLDGLVNDGTISQDQEDKIIQAFKDAKPEKAPGQGPGQGQGPLGRRGRGAAAGQILKGMVDVAANTIGVPPSDLANELKSGKSVADVATAHNVDPQTVVQAIVDAGNTKVDEAVTNGKLTSAQGDKIKSHLSDAATKFVNHTRPNC
jgi:polyhydroxyalkanoate synthesis regulator phasin